MILLFLEASLHLIKRGVDSLLGVIDMYYDIFMIVVIHLCG